MKFFFITNFYFFKKFYQRTFNADAGEDSLTDCINCVSGWYSDVLGAIICKICPTGTYNSIPGSSACTNCSAG